ncbi:hypothetical protein [Litoreibacter arenae]|uniref:Uncharacterized protein n=1 Tax=Litoreibacter arenae DSM 19593 TaxID=1123360 RepID=S9QIL8_9RHOB|nr:hypothetical protein [Litoreibacter arenae]EPX81316.1 hypothetical protein thalar_00766 [Litoreibacter arenae DSM 19593]
MNQIINMVMRMVLRRLVNMGINKGIDVAAKRGKAGKELTPEQRRGAGEQSKRAKQAVRMSRRIGRF